MKISIITGTFIHRRQVLTEIFKKIFKYTG
jgi:hypothetical protein